MCESACRSARARPPRSPATWRSDGCVVVPTRRSDGCVVVVADHLDRLPRGDQTVVLLYSYADDGRLVDSALATLEEELKSLRIVLPRGRCELLPRGRYEPLGCRRCCTLYTAARTGRLPRGRYVLLGGGMLGGAARLAQ